jgi:predicted nucleic acid-binding protein
MIVVVADSSPINYLVLIGSIDVLRQLYGAVVVPQQVISELIDSAAPHAVQAWASDLPTWIDVRNTVVPDDDMIHLDRGERAAIVLAQSESNALLLIDETAGRIEASRRGIRNTGTLGVLRAAALKGHADLPTALARLLETNFRVSPELVTALLAEDAERHRKQVVDPDSGASKATE